MNSRSVVCVHHFRAIGHRFTDREQGPVVSEAGTSGVSKHDELDIAQLNSLVTHYPTRNCSSICLTIIIIAFAFLLEKD